MSACISRHGEFSAHELGEHFECLLCGVLGEEELLNQSRRLAATLAFIDTTIYANEDSSKEVVWRNEEVLKMLGEIRAALVTDPEPHDSGSVS